MRMSFRYNTIKDLEFDLLEGKYKNVYKRGALHKVIAKTEDECNRSLESLFNYLMNEVEDFISEGLGEANYNNLTNQWEGESYIFLECKSDFAYYKEKYKKWRN